MKISTALWGLLLGFSFMACETGGDNGGFLPTASGYDYKILKSEGGEKPSPGDYAYFHAYFYIQDSMLQSTRQLGQEPSLQVPKEGEAAASGPVEEVLGFMGVGDSALVRMHLDSLPQRPPEFADAEYIHYYIALERFLTEDEFKAEQQARMMEQKAVMDATIARAPEVVAAAQATREQYLAGSLTDLQSTETGLKYVLHDPGSGADADPGRQVSVNYVGMLTDGTIFDQSFERGSPIPFQLGTGQVIRGWDEGIDLLKEGGKATFFIPSDLAYGEQGRPGSIPGGAELVFYVELEEVK